MGYKGILIAIFEKKINFMTQIKGLPPIFNGITPKFSIILNIKFKCIKKGCAGHHSGLVLESEKVKMH
jgi:hypothetical protein